MPNPIPLLLVSRFSSPHRDFQRQLLFLSFSLFVLLERFEICNDQRKKEIVRYGFLQGMGMPIDTKSRRL